MDSDGEKQTHGSILRCLPRSQDYGLGVNDLATTNPEMLEERDYAANDAEHLSPQAVRANQAIKVHWICEKCGHKWIASLSNRCGGGTGWSSVRR